MEIKKADSKGRLTVGEDGRAYFVREQEDGSILLTPVPLPKQFPKDSLQEDDLRAIYWSPARYNKEHTLTIFSVLPNDFEEKVIELANSLRLPVVVDDYGIGAVFVDKLGSKVDRGVFARSRMVN